MRHIAPLRLALLAVLSLVACNRYLPPYRYGLLEVERPANAANQYGPTKVSTLDSVGLNWNVFEDGLIQSAWSLQETSVVFSLRNKTNHSIKIPWDDAAFVNSAGTSQRVIHSSIKVDEREKPQSPSVVARNSSIHEALTPADNIEWSHYSSSWILQFLDRAMMIETRDSVAARRQFEELQSKRVRVILPLVIEGTTNEYTFTFGLIDPAAN